MIVSLIVVVAVLSDTHVGSLRPHWLQRFGYSPVHLFQGNFYRIATSLLLTAGGWQFYATVLMLGTIVGVAEWNCGTRKVMITFLAMHGFTLVALALLLAWPLQCLGLPRGDLLANVHDVGPSAGYYGCVGLAVSHLPRGRWRVVVIVVFVKLLARLVWSSLMLPEHGHMLTADAAHVIALVGGLVWAAASQTRFDSRDPCSLSS
ncbi:MAG: hypothetical protein JJ992_25155 [Planctomycetes bacterium]|nr:hypothetical protein [Planctomycetota bacterium]